MAIKLLNGKTDKVNVEVSARFMIDLADLQEEPTERDWKVRLWRNWTENSTSVQYTFWLWSGLVGRWSKHRSRTNRSVVPLSSSLEFFFKSSEEFQGVHVVLLGNLTWHKRDMKELFFRVLLYLRINCKNHNIIYSTDQCNIAAFIAQETSSTTGKYGN